MLETYLVRLKLTLTFKRSNLLWWILRLVVDSAPTTHHERPGADTTQPSQNRSSHGADDGRASGDTGTRAQQPPRLRGTSAQPSAVRAAQLPQADAMADDIEIDLAKMSLWTKGTRACIAGGSGFGFGVSVHPHPL